jgi:outer membrane protein OmpA-like peptidoglycan-associated protein
MRLRLLAPALLLAACQTSGQPTRAVLLDVPFAAGSWAAAPATGPALDALAAALRDDALQRESFVVRVAVPAGEDPEAARTLSRLRAAAIVDGLVRRGLARSRLAYDGLGADPGGERVEVIALR